MATVGCISVAEAARRGFHTVRGARKVPCYRCGAQAWVSRFMLAAVEAGARVVCHECLPRERYTHVAVPDPDLVRRAGDDLLSD
jgi:catechol 2,3-dioxygenase-like lactoylglutathione lyase family enzyme